MSIKTITPSGSMSLLTQVEADIISEGSQGALYELYRNCSLAVLNSGNITDNSKELLDNYQDFKINVIRNERGVKIELINPPETAIVDGEVIKCIEKHLYAVLRDIVQIGASKSLLEHTNLNTDYNHDKVANVIFSILRLARILKSGQKPNIAVCWGGHSISQKEYDYAYKVGYELGLRGIDICTGCGPGIMEAPMKGSLIGHTLQGLESGSRRIGLTEPSIIAAEPPNSMVSDLVILPDIEKRLEAFVRFGHVLLVFPGGPGTVEELLFILSIKLTHENRHNVLPLILTGNEDSVEYFNSLDNFLKLCFGEDISRHYKIIINDPKQVAVETKKGMELTFDHRTITHDSYCYNWSLHIPSTLQEPFDVTHENMAALDLHKNQDKATLAANLRKAFSGIVTGNVKEHGIKLVAQKGPFVLHGDKEIIEHMDKLLKDFIAQGRILLSNKKYIPCYKFEK